MRRTGESLMRTLAVLAVTALSVAALHAQAPRGTWVEKAKLNELRHEPGAVVLNGKLYAIGGMARGQDSHPLVEVYDIRTDTWTEGTPMPGPLSHPAVVALDDKIYVVGGFLRNVHLDAQDKAFEFDPKTNAWRTLAPMKAPRGSVGLAVVGGKLHAIGGRDVNRVTVNTHEMMSAAPLRPGEVLADRYMPKPYNLDDMEVLLREMLEE
jgi:N-acetylneuraminic acid mutarotase